jgi:hypothetical protein
MAGDITISVGGNRPISSVVQDGQGPPGPPSAGAAGFNFAQSVAASVWTINHNLGYRPTVALQTGGGVELIGQVSHLSANTVQVTFTTPRTGTARCI